MDNILNPLFFLVLFLAIKFETVCVVIIINLSPYVFPFVMLKSLS